MVDNFRMGIFPRHVSAEDILLVFRGLFPGTLSQDPRLNTLLYFEMGSLLSIKFKPSMKNRSSQTKHTHTRIKREREKERSLFRQSHVSNYAADIYRWDMIKYFL